MDKETTLLDLLEAVEDEASFLRFAKALQADKEDEDRKQKSKPRNPYGHGPNGWEASSIAEYLESAIAWAEDSDFGEIFEATNHWKKFALFLYGGKIYE